MLNRRKPSFYSLWFNGHHVKDEDIYPVWNSLRLISFGNTSRQKEFMIQRRDL